ncbi:MAG: SemiSWEET transporter [Alphaproteobacteria bacterium]|uniref:SemiSWEET transporter n=1 Tax=Candidatus Nitrobium versatile TaxID=2884831 RepID=A0A953J9F7_9BACT|nr:SemiSWEET transporter [Candidatus Nitrobium versatile]
MDAVTLLGLIAAMLTTSSFVPQVVRTWRLKETKDISLWMFLLIGAGIFLWMIYGFLIRDLPVIAANMVSFMFVSLILYFKIKYR